MIAALAALAADGSAAIPLGIGARTALIVHETEGADRRAAFAAETALHSGGTAIGFAAGGAVIGFAAGGAVIGVLGPATTLVVTGLVQVVLPVLALRALPPLPRRPSGRWRR